MEPASGGGATRAEGVPARAPTPTRRNFRRAQGERAFTCAPLPARGCAPLLPTSTRGGGVLARPAPRLAISMAVHN